MIGIGVDVVEIERFRQSLARTPSMRERLFTEIELAYVAPKNDPVLERRERKVEDAKADQVRDADKVEISEKAQNLAQVEETARATRQQLERSNESLSGGRIVDQRV